MNIPRAIAGLRVLIVADEVAMPADLTAALEAAGCEVVARVAGGRAAVEAALRGFPDLILMEVGPSEDFDGVRAAEMIQEFLEVPVVYLTDLVDHATPRIARAIHAAGYLRKPVQSGELLAGIEVAVERFDRQRQLERRHLSDAALLGSVADGVVATSLDGQVEFLNPAAERLTGWTIGEAHGRAAAEILRFADVQGRPRPGPPLASVRTSRTAALLDPGHYVLGRYGALTPVEGTIAPVTDARARLVGIAITLRNPSESPRRRIPPVPGVRSLVSVQLALIPRSPPDRAPRGTGAGKA